MATVKVTAAARLHLGFLDLHGGLGRRYGSIGLSIEGAETVLTLSDAAAPSADGPERQRAAHLAARFAEALRLDPARRLEILSAIPAHAGLGSGTQLALAIAAAFRRLDGLAPDLEADAEALDRGARSGVGAALFDRGGLVLDAGRGVRTTLPPPIARLPFPPAWRALVAIDPRLEGVHGEAETRALADLPPFPASAAAECCRLALMQVLPGAAEADFSAFGDGLARLQQIVGDHFAPAQGGGRFLSRAVGEAVARMEALGARGGGQSSWGPTGFAFACDPEAAERIVVAARRACDPALQFLVARALDRGAAIEGPY